MQVLIAVQKEGYNAELRCTGQADPEVETAYWTLNRQDGTQLVINIIPSALNTSLFC